MNKCVGSDGAQSKDRSAGRLVDYPKPSWVYESVILSALQTGFISVIDSVAASVAWLFLCDATVNRVCRRLTKLSEVVH